MLSGPGGDFLSNEVSYRVLRLLAETKSAKKPISFHTHTEKGNLIPQKNTTKDEKKDLAEANKTGKTIRDRLIARLTKAIRVSQDHHGSTRRKQTVNSLPKSWMQFFLCAPSVFSVPLVSVAAKY